ncbi:MAG: CpaD family pilus assembly protein [Parvibaculum sp.]
MKSEFKMHKSSNIVGRIVLPFVVVLALAGCGGFNGAENAQFDASYTHPISVQPDVPTLEVAATGHLSNEDRQAIVTFAAAYKERGHGVLTVAAPSGSANTAVAMNVLVEVRDMLAKAGVPIERVSYTPYRASGAAERAPIIMSYKQYVASVAPCGDWSENLAYDPGNGVPKNFGCATQTNLAAMVADPADLVMPRTMTPSDAQRRGEVFAKYRKGEITATARDQRDSAAVSEVNK